MTIAPQVPDFTEAIHLAAGTALASIGKGLSCIWLQDCLRIGPCALDTEQHFMCRYEYWMTEFERREKYASRRDAPRRRREHEESLHSQVTSAKSLKRHLDEFPSSRPIAVWTSQNWSDSLLCWWLMSCFARMKTLLDRIWLVSCETTEPLAVQGVDVLSRFYADDVAPLRQDQLDDAAQMWHQFVSNDPTGFSESLLAVLPHAAREYYRCFPRAVEDSVKLSELDQFLFDNLASDHWLRPVDLMIQMLNDWEDIGAWFGDLLVASRLIQWDNPVWPVLESRPIEGVNACTSVEYRLTELGTQLRDTGLSVLEKAPTIWTGGCELYAGPQLWCVEGIEGTAQLTTRRWP